MIYFTKPSITDQEKKYVSDALDSEQLSGDKKYTKLCTEWFNHYGFKNFWFFITVVHCLRYRWVNVWR